ncbi:hypothetical protein [Kosakonia sacchari]|uniref:hypothetical protein n=1 Tax=Kosakonia sacchari TaxID=1158459 RepID=UPI001584BC55|nr:hypothetical protein [Kosakonia sacchari]NUL39836.1 hypothetical protein [Kosakonia sacchari]
MYTGISLYGTEQTNASSALSLGVSIFESLGFSIVGCGYNKYLKNGDHKGDHDFVDVTLPELENAVSSGEVNSFRIYDEKAGHTPWCASFGLSTNDFGSFHHIDIQLPIITDDILNSIIRKITSSVSFEYGIIYKCDKASKAFYYSTGDNLVSIYPYENPSLFKRDTPGRFNGVETYRHSKLRMIYPFNLINRQHLNIQVDGLTLDKWIIGNNFGELIKLNDELWCWAIDEQLIEPASKILGDAGVLISWKQNFSKK